MGNRDRQIVARQTVGRLEIFKRHLIDMVLASVSRDTAVHAKAVPLRHAADERIAAYGRELDYPLPACLPSTAHYLRTSDSRLEPADEPD